MPDSTFTRAITRKPGADFDRGLTSAGLGDPDHALMVIQHEAYVRTLTALDLEVIRLDPLPGFPDAYFVEDAAVVTPELAILTRPGAPSRRGEETALEPVLARYRKTVRIEPPGTVDGGDVLTIGKHMLIGISERTNRAGFDQMAAILEPHGYTVTPVPVSSGLHLKSSVNHVGAGTLLVDEAFADRFPGYRTIRLHPAEAYAGNTLLVNGTLIMPRGFSATRRKLQTLGMEIVELDMSEAAKMDGGLTCMSLRF
jgi:dimethylargininase